MHMWVHMRAYLLPYTAALLPTCDRIRRTLLVLLLVVSTKFSPSYHAFAPAWIPVP